jgi:hypothetical protein
VDEIKELEQKIARAEDNGYFKDNEVSYQIEATLVLAKQVERVANVLEAAQGGLPIIVHNRGN